MEGWLHHLTEIFSHLGMHAWKAVEEREGILPSLPLSLHIITFALDVICDTRPCANPAVKNCLNHQVHS